MKTDQLTFSIRRQHQLIEENQRERNEKFQNCIQKFTKHLQDEIQMVEKSLVSNQQRNDLYNQGFETVYNRMLTGAQQIIRKMTSTLAQKRDFWKRVIESHPEITSLQTKSDCYENYSDMEQKYYEAIECQKISKVPYKVILGNQELDNGLEIEQMKNKQLEAHVSLSRKNSQENWNNSSRVKPVTTQYAKPDSIISDQVIDKFMKTNNRAPAIPRPPSAQRPGSSRSKAEKQESLLNDFMKRG